MKRFGLLLFLLLTGSFSLFGQRYLTPQFSFVTHTGNIGYGRSTTYQNVDENLLLDWYEPASDTATKRPLIIYIHGGGFTDTNQTRSLVHIFAYCDSLAVRGYAVASIDYRLDTSISNRAVINALHDAKAAVRYFKRLSSAYRIDTSLIFIAGESAGGVTALNVAYLDQTSELAYPPVGPYPADTSLEGNSGSPGFSSNVKAVMALCAGTQTSTNELLFDTSAIQSANDPPLLMMHGSSDANIPFARAVEIAQRANNLSLGNLFYALPGAVHCPWFFPLPNNAAYMDTLIASTVPFLYACVLTGATNVSPEIPENSMLAYPNPSNGELHIALPTAITEQLEITLFDLAGKLVFKHSQYPDGRNLSYDLSHLAKGSYILKVLGEEGFTANQRIVLK